MASASASQGEEEEFIRFPKRNILLNKEQYNAVIRPANVHQRILASAGSGKTTTLTARIAWLIHRCNIPAEAIVLITFSRNAANQMKTRLENVLGETNVWIGTFHGLARSLLKKYDPVSLQKLYFIDELIYMGIGWLRESSKGIQWAASIKYVVIDEFQDINASQWQMVEAIRRPSTRLIVVGDDAQNIYTWRGSSVSFILDLHTKVPGLVDDQLRTNYRSTPSIISVANGTLRHIPSLPWKGTMIPAINGNANGSGSGAKPEVHFFWRGCDETEWILRQMELFHKIYPKWTFAVLSRTNADLFHIEEVLQSKGISYRLRDILDEDVPPSKKSLDLVTLHASKGLEWDCVFFIGCNDDVFPSKKSDAEIICERRLFYVGVTRARSMLFLTYTTKERALSRFVREIPRHYLTYTGLSRYTLSDYDRAEGKSRLIDILSALDGTKLQRLRALGTFKTIEKEMWKMEQIFPPGMWCIPSWAMRYDRGGDFLRFLRIWIYRHIWKTIGDEKLPFREPALERVLFTLRVYAEEREFFDLWREEFIEMFHAFFEKVLDTMPPVEFHMVKAWAIRKNLNWSVEELIKATTLLAKLRGQLRPLRFEKYDLNEFRIGFSRYVVPTESRADVLRSWKRVSDRGLGWREILPDIWRLGALELCAEGRNAAMYRVIEMSAHLDSVIEYLEMVEGAMAPWITHASASATQFGIELTNQDIFTDTLDILSGETLWEIHSATSAPDALSILELAVRGSLARKEGLNMIRSVGWIQPLDGTITRIQIDDTWDKCVEVILGA